MARGRVLIADDNAVYRRLLARFIGAHQDLEVVGEAEDGLSAVSLCAELKPDVVVMDLRMPGADGFEATRLVKAAVPGARVIAITAHRCEDDAQRCLEAGAEAFLSKGQADIGLIALIRELVVAESRGGLPVDGQSRPSEAPPSGS
ncbi:MAG TPA: response regulator transcription factor [Coriobacteriia bacterium]